VSNRFKNQNTTHLHIDVMVAYNGTTVRHEQHNANMLRMPVPTYNWSLSDQEPGSKPALTSKVALRTLGVHKVASHTGHVQCEGFVYRVEECFDLLKGSALHQQNQKALVLCFGHVVLIKKELMVQM
jgi:hypothetical protein